MVILNMAIPSRHVGEMSPVATKATFSCAEWSFFNIYITDISLLSPHMWRCGDHLLTSGRCHCWADVVDAGQKVDQHWVNVSCLLGNSRMIKAILSRLDGIIMVKKIFVTKRVGFCHRTISQLLRITCLTYGSFGNNLASSDIIY